MPAAGRVLPDALKDVWAKLLSEADLGDSAQVLQQMERDIEGARWHLGLAILESPTNYHPSAGNKVHEALWNVKWNAEGMMKMDPHKLCEFECVLTGHQAWVRGQENTWTARYRLLGYELDRQAFRKRDQYTGNTKAAQELKMFEGQQSMRVIRQQYAQAWVMSTLLEGMGDTFKQIEDGLKRTISLVSEEYRRAHYSK